MLCSGYTILVELEIIKKNCNNQKNNSNSNNNNYNNNNNNNNNIAITIILGYHSLMA